MNLEWLKMLKNSLQQVRAADVSDLAAERRVIEFCRHWDGHVREAAVGKLGAAQSAEAFNALLVRLNDWVPQVRTAATVACANYVRLERLDVILSCLGSVLALTRKSRADHAAFLGKIGTVLDMSEARGAVLRFFPGSRGEVARYLLARMLAWEGADHAEVMSLAARHPDFTVRTALIAACEQQGCPQAVLQKLLGDAHPRNRKAAFQALWHKTADAPQRRELLHAALLDEALPVRELALHCARQTGFAVEAFLEQQAAGFPSDGSADVGLLGLAGMLADPQYLPLIRQAFSSQRPALRRAALAAWANVSRETADTAAAEALTDPSGKVFKLASRLALKGKVALSRDQLTGAAQKALGRQGLGRLVEIARLMPIWDRLESLLDGLRQAASAEDAQALAIAMREWEHDQRYAYSSLGNEQRLRLRALIEQTGYAQAPNPEMRFALLQAGLLEN